MAISRLVAGGAYNANATLTATIPANALIMAGIVYGGTSYLNYNLVDNANTGNYTQLQYQINTTGSFVMQTFSIVNQNPQSSITITKPASFLALVAAIYTGFVNTPTIVTGDYALGNVTSSGTTWGGASFNASQNNECFYGLLTPAGASSFTGTAFTGVDNYGGVFQYELLNQSSGTNIQFSGSFAASETYSISSVQGFYDAQTNSAPYTPFNRTQFFVTDTIIQQ